MVLDRKLRLNVIHVGFPRASSGSAEALGTFVLPRCYPITPDSDRFAPVRGFTDQGHIPLGSDETGDALADDRVVIDRQDPNRIGIGADHWMALS